MDQQNLAHLRENYTKSALDISDVHADPIEQFRRWMDEAIQSQIMEPNMMTLATASAQGIPSARTMLLKGFDADGFSFFTNYSSHKGQNLDENPHAALVFLWGELERQVNIRGSVEKISREESEQYFQVRPRASQIGAWASTQSKAIPDRQWIIDREKELNASYPEGTEIPLPDFWGGYRVVPNYIEFWQGRPSRLHDRIVFQKEGESWTISRFSP